MENSTRPELISFKLCPFVHRAVIMLREKGVGFDTTYIDLGDKPEWFLRISPLGKVPVLRVADVVLFESAIINEYLDETHPPALHPQDPERRAHNRLFRDWSIPHAIRTELVNQPFRDSEDATVAANVLAK